MKITKFTPYEKLSKKKQKEQNMRKRSTWGPLNPVTRKPLNPKAYNRKKAQQWSDDSGAESFLFVYCSPTTAKNKRSASLSLIRLCDSPKGQ